MHPAPRAELVLLLFCVTVLAFAAGLTTTANTGGKGGGAANETLTLIAAESAARVKRGYSTGHSTGVAYNRINDAGHVRLLNGGGRRGHGGGHGGGHGDDEDDGHGGGEKGGEGGGAVGED